MKAPTLRSVVEWLWLIIPVIVGGVLNAVARPMLAANLDGQRVIVGARGTDGRWVFNEQTQNEHPALTRFLEMPDGQVAFLTLCVIVVCGFCVLILGQRCVTPGRR
jgi:hypothetical protein